MIVGVGVDLVRIDRIGRLLDRYGSRFARKVFTPTEWTESGGRVSHLAGRFAVKEAADAVNTHKIDPHAHNHGLSP